MRYYVAVSFLQGQTPLFLAASQGHVEMVHMLVAAGARRYIPDNMDQTPEEIAGHKEYKEVTQYFTNLRIQNGSTTNGNGTSKRKNVKVILAKYLMYFKSLEL